MINTKGKILKRNKVMVRYNNGSSNINKRSLVVAVPTFAAHEMGLKHGDKMEAFVDHPPYGDDVLLSFRKIPANTTDT